MIVVCVWRRGGLGVQTPVLKAAIQCYEPSPSRHQLRVLVVGSMSWSIHCLQSLVC
jgi:hypothetical protein